MSLSPFSGISPFSHPRGVGAAFVPTDISGCKLWLKARSVAGSDGDLIASITDDSGNSNTATATALHKATLKTGILNSTNILRFSAAATSWYTVANSWTGSNWTFFFTIIPTTTTPGGLIDTGPGLPNVFRNYVAGNFDWHDASPNRSFTLANTNPVIFCVRTSLAPSRLIKLNINGGTATTASNASTTAMAWITPTIGTINQGSGGAGPTFLGADLGEVIWYNSTLSDSDCNLVGNYIAGWSGISWTNI